MDIDGIWTQVGKYTDQKASRRNWLAKAQMNLWLIRT